MFDKVRSIMDNNQDENSILEGSSFKGSINTDGVVRVWGEISEANVKADRVYIKPEAKVEAKMEVNNLEVEGTFIGDVNAEVRVVMTSTARVLGSVSTKEMVTSEGVMFEGTCKVTSEAGSDVARYIKEGH